MLVIAVIVDPRKQFTARSNSASVNSERTTSSLVEQGHTAIGAFDDMPELCIARWISSFIDDSRAIIGLISHTQRQPGFFIDQLVVGTIRVAQINLGILNRGGFAPLAAHQYHSAGC